MADRQPYAVLPSHPNLRGSPVVYSATTNRIAINTMTAATTAIRTRPKRLAFRGSTSCPGSPSPLSTISGLEWVGIGGRPSTTGNSWPIRVAAKSWSSRNWYSSCSSLPSVNAALSRDVSCSRSASVTGASGLLRYGDEIGRLLLLLTTGQATRPPNLGPVLGL